MLPLGFFASAAITVPTLVGSVLNFCLYGILFALSLFFQDIHHSSAALTGVALLFLLGSVLTSTPWSTKTSGLRTEILASKIGNVKRLHEEH